MNTFASGGPDLARLYDLDFAEDPGDVDMYLSIARRTGGPILELAVGTGRVAVPLAAAGYDVAGVDIDPQMLARARERAAAAGQSAGRLDLIEANILDLRLDDAGRYMLAIIALNSLMLLGSREAQREAIRTTARHLAPGGLAVVDVWLPDADDLARFDGRVVLEYVRAPDDGPVVTKASSAQHEASSQQVTLTTIYEESPPGGDVRRWVRVDRLRLVGADELRGFAEDVGLEVEQLAGGYDLSPLGPASDRAVLIATLP